MIVLGIETSCDETAAAVVERNADGGGRILSDIVLSQTADHAAFGGVVPEIAARAHVEALDGIVAASLRAAGLGFTDIDAVAATAGPGLIGAVIVGLSTGKAIALAAGKPLVAVNHLEGHALTARLTDALAFPYLLLLVSGGHSQFLAVEDVGAYRRIGTTLDDALGESFDKAAKLLGLAYPGGPKIERLARAGDPARFALPRPLLGRPGADFSFSGLKTALRLAAESVAPLSGRDVADLAASFQAAVTDIVADRARHAMDIFVEMHAHRGTLTAVVSNSDSTLPLWEGRNAEGVSGRGGGGRASPEDTSNSAHPSPKPLRGFDPPTRGGLEAEQADPTALRHSGESRNPGAADRSLTQPPLDPDFRQGDGEDGIRGRDRRERPVLVIAGGVAANQAIRAALKTEAERRGFALVAPPVRLCSDNAVMIAWAGAERLSLGLADPLDFAARPRWPLDEIAAPTLGAGRKGARA